MSPSYLQLAYYQASQVERQWLTDSMSIAYVKNEKKKLTLILLSGSHCHRLGVLLFHLKLNLQRKDTVRKTNKPTLKNINIIELKTL
jgi:hypothetical protein